MISVIIILIAYQCKKSALPKRISQSATLTMGLDTFQVYRTYIAFQHHHIYKYAGQLRGSYNENFLTEQPDI